MSVAGHRQEASSSELTESLKQTDVLSAKASELQARVAWHTTPRKSDGAESSRCASSTLASQADRLS